MVSRFLGLIFLTACSAQDPIGGETIVVSTDPPGAGGVDATAPSTPTPPFNCFNIRTGSDTAVWICENLAPYHPGDPEPKNAGDPLR